MADSDDAKQLDEATKISIQVKLSPETLISYNENRKCFLDDLTLGQFLDQCVKDAAIL